MDDSGMKIGAIAPWFGGKRTLAPTIVQELGQHVAYWEPFCGSMSVLFAKPRSPIETVNDLHGDVVNLAYVLASRRWSDLYEACRRVLQCEPLLREFQRLLNEAFLWPASVDAITDDHVQRAACFLAVSWIGRNGVAGTRKRNQAYALRWTRTGGSPNVRWRGVLESIPAWHDRLQGVSILRRDGFGILEHIADEACTAVYIDPPYFLSTRGKGGGVVYEHDFSDEAHVALARLANRFRRARVVVSYYDDIRLAKLYPAWTKRDIATSKNLANTVARKEGRTKAPEVLLLNGPSYAQDDAGLFGQAGEAERVGA